jgi:hypothetical protein
MPFETTPSGSTSVWGLRRVYVCSGCIICSPMASVWVAVWYRVYVGWRLLCIIWNYESLLLRVVVLGVCKRGPLWARYSRRGYICCQDCRLLFTLLSSWILNAGCPRHTILRRSVVCASQRLCWPRPHLGVPFGSRCVAASRRSSSLGDSGSMAFTLVCFLVVNVILPVLRPKPNRFPTYCPMFGLWL